MQRLGIEMQNALDLGDDIRYLKAHTPIDKNGKVRNTILTEFDNG